MDNDPEAREAIDKCLDALQGQEAETWLRCAIALAGAALAKIEDCGVIRAAFDRGVSRQIERFEESTRKASVEKVLN
jgi:hypothetical protein